MFQYQEKVPCKKTSGTGVRSKSRSCPIPTMDDPVYHKLCGHIFSNGPYQDHRTTIEIGCMYKLSV